jgi:hypothetical protein
MVALLDITTRRRHPHALEVTPKDRNAQEIIPPRSSAHAHAITRQPGEENGCREYSWPNALTNENLYAAIRPSPADHAPTRPGFG